MKITNVFVLICLGLCSIVSGQEYAIDKKATIISGTASLMNQGGDLFEGSNGKHATTITFTPNINHFITRNFFVGGGIELSNQSQGNYKSNSISIGPQIGYAFGNSSSKAFPYIDLGIRYYSSTENFDAMSGDLKITGSEILLGFGVIVPVNTHIGLIFEGGYQKLNIKNKQYNIESSGNIFSMGVGIAGLLFK